MGKVYVFEELVREVGKEISAVEYTKSVNM